MVVAMPYSDFETVAVAASCVEVTDSQKLILGLHPDPKKWPDRAKIEQCLESLGDRAIVSGFLVKGMNTMQALACLGRNSAVLMTGFSGGGTTAAYSGYNVAIADGPEIRTIYAQICPPGDGLLPLAASLGAPVVQAGRPVDVFNLAYPSTEAVTQTLRPFDAEKAAAVITST